MWKRKAEEYLVQQAAGSGGALAYTIVHPGGLIDEAGGQRQLVSMRGVTALHARWCVGNLRGSPCLALPAHLPPRLPACPPAQVLDVDDNLISSGSKYRRVPRADVAEFCVQCLVRALGMVCWLCALVGASPGALLYCAHSLRSPAHRELQCETVRAHA